jgi:hypothetical protein
MSWWVLLLCVPPFNGLLVALVIGAAFLWQDVRNRRRVALPVAVVLKEVRT